LFDFDIIKGAAQGSLRVILLTVLLTVHATQMLVPSKRMPFGPDSTW